MTCREAAAALVQLCDENARLQAAHDHQYAVAGTMLRTAERAEAEVARLKQWQVDMVAKAADKSLDGYRELGAKCAALEAERDALKQDAERLDWVMKQFANWWPDRNAIDAARKKT